jgi:DNA-binding transcriptional regulator YbjK
MRRDARARREALLEAAAACFDADGFGVPLEDIAARAGVGRGTTRAMVYSSLLILIANFFLTLLLNLIFPAGSSLV